MSRRRNYGARTFAPQQAPAWPTPENPWREDDRVRYQPSPRKPEPGAEYSVCFAGHLNGVPVVRLRGWDEYFPASHFVSVDAPPETTAADHLAEARAAWHMKLAAESQLRRLASYRSLSVGMKADRQRMTERLAQAESTLKRILIGAP